MSQLLISEIISELITETGGDADDSALTTEWLTLLKGAIRRLPGNVRDRTILTISYATLGSGNQVMTLPGYFISERQVWKLENGRRTEVTKLIGDEFNAQYKAEGGSLDFYRIYRKFLEFNRKAQADTTIEVEHFKDPTIDLATTDTFFGNSNLLEIVKDYAKFTHFHGVEEDRAKGADYLQLAQDAAQEQDTEFLEEEIGGYVVES